VNKYLRSISWCFATLFFLPVCYSQPVANVQNQHFQNIKSDSKLLRQYLERFPKGADLHNHLSGAIYAESYLKWAAEDDKCIQVNSQTITLPPCRPEKENIPVRDIIAEKTQFDKAIDALSIRHYQRKNRSGHDQFFSTFKKFSAASKGREGHMLAEVTSRAGKQNIVYLELIVLFGMFEAAALDNDMSNEYTEQSLRHLMGSENIASIRDKVITLTDKMEAEKSSLLGCETLTPDKGCHVTVRYIPAMLRTLPKSSVMFQTALAFNLLNNDPRYVGINLVGPEDSKVALNDYDWHMSLIRDMAAQISSHKAPISLHAGELTPTLVSPKYLNDHIHKAINIAGAVRVGHGTSLFYENNHPDLLRQLNKQKILVEINLTSNDVILGVSGEQHPFRALLAADVPMAVSTDDEGVSRIDLTHEYQRAVETYDLDYSTLKNLSRNSLEYSFLSGRSLFEETSPYIRRAECKQVNTRCNEFLAANEKAGLQWQLELQFLKFEKEMLISNRSSSTNIDSPTTQCKTKPLTHLPSNQCTLIKKGSSQKIILIGDILAEDQVFAGGSVTIGEDGRIESLGCSIGKDSNDQEASIIACPGAIISPGFVDAHAHIRYGNNDPSDLQLGDERFNHRNQWRFGLDGHTKIPFWKDTSPYQTQWTELRMVLAGTTSIAKNDSFRNNPSVGWARDLDTDIVQQGVLPLYTDVFPLGDMKDPVSRERDCNYSSLISEHIMQQQAFEGHVAEGINLAAANEIRCLIGLNSSGVNITSSTTNYVHMVGGSAQDGAIIAKTGGSVIWAPRSNTMLYGNSAPIPMYANQGVNISLSSDWTLSGSITLLRELKCASEWSSTYYNNQFSSYDLWLMSTINPAIGFGLADDIGSLAPGKWADIAIFKSKNGLDVFDSVVKSHSPDALLVMRAGVPLVGQPQVIESLPSIMDDDCETIPSEFLPQHSAMMACVKREVGVNFQTFHHKAGKVYPLSFGNNTPPGEPSCIPARPGEYSGIPTSVDSDGDGIANKDDNCPLIFNPIRPMDAGAQADSDGDGKGDMCDTVPLSYSLPGAVRTDYFRHIGTNTISNRA
jgi:adenosine deaminase